MAAKTPTKTPTSGGAGAQVPAYTGASGGAANVPTALESAPYQVLPWNGPDVPIPGAFLTTGKAATPAQLHQAALEGLARYFNITTAPPGTTVEEQVTEALAGKYGVSPTSHYASMDVAPSTPKPAQKGKGFDAQRVERQEQGGVDTTAPPRVTSRSATPNTNALHEIASKLGLDQGEDPLVAIAGKLGIHNADSGQAFGSLSLSKSYADTTAQQYAGFVAVAFDKKGNLTKQGKAIEANLVQAGYLDVNTSGGTPSANDVQKAYQSFLSASVNGISTGNPATSLPPGQGMQAAIAYGEKQAKGIQANATSSESYAYTQGIAAEFGVYLTPNQINSIISDPKIAAEITSTGSPTNVADQIKDMVIKMYDPSNPNDPAGVANSMYVQLQQAALDYQLPLNAANLSAMVKNGLQTASVAYPASAVNDVVAKATQSFQDQAAGLYPTLAAQIKAGAKLGGSGGMFAPYFNVAESITGVPAATMMADQQQGGLSKWGAFTQGGHDPKTGAPTLQSLDEWKKTLMQDPQYGFDKTQGGRDMGEQISAAILNEFGKVNTESGPAFDVYRPSSALQANTPG